MTIGIPKARHNASTGVVTVQPMSAQEEESYLIEISEISGRSRDEIVAEIESQLASWHERNVALYREGKIVLLDEAGMPV